MGNSFTDGAATTSGTYSAAGRYTTATLMAARYGTPNLTRWGDPDNTGVTATINTNLQTAIDEAEGIIDTLFRDSRYVVPFAPVPSRVAVWARDLAVILVYFARGRDYQNDELARKYRAAEKLLYRQMVACQSGRTHLPSANADQDQPTAPAVIG